MVTNDNNLKRPLRLDEPSVGHIRLFDGDSDSRIVTWFLKKLDTYLKFLLVRIVNRNVYFPPIKKQKQIIDKFMEEITSLIFVTDLCLVLLCDQIDLDLTIMIWSQPKWNGHNQNHYGQVQINLVRPKPFWTDQNCFGHIEGQGIKELTCCRKISCHYKVI